jgi:nicotinamide-nucleotide amidase
MFPLELHELAAELLSRYRAAGLKLAIAESCTGGLIAGCLSEIPGSSDVFDRGFVTYSYESKADLLGVPIELIRERGAVDIEVAKRMAFGAVERANRADVAVAVTGVAGPGQSETKPAGLVYVAGIRRGGDPVARELRFTGNRSAVRLQAVEAAMELALELI